MDPWLSANFSEDDSEEDDYELKRVEQLAPPKKKVRVTYHKPPSKTDEYLLFAKTVQASVVRQLCDVLDRLLADVNVIVDETGMKVAAMDKSKVCLVHLKLEADKFEDYQCKKPQMLGTNMTELSKLRSTWT